MPVQGCEVERLIRRYPIGPAVRPGDEAVEACSHLVSDAPHRPVQSPCVAAGTAESALFATRTGMIIGTVFTILLMVVCALSRSIRSVEFRIPHGYFTDVESFRLGPEVRGKKVHLVPIRNPSPEARSAKRAEVARYYNVRSPFLFLHVHLLDNRSEFSAPLEISLRKDDGDYVAEVFGAVAIANTIAYLSEAMPMAVVWGRDDQVIPVRHASNAAALAPDVRVEVLPDAGHFPHKNHPEEFARILDDFVSSTQPASYNRARFRRMLKAGGSAPASPVETLEGAPEPQAATSA